MGCKSPVNIRQKRHRFAKFCPFHLNMQTICRGLYKHATECEGDHLSGFVWRCIAAYVYYDKVIETGHRLYTRGESPHNYEIITHLYKELGEKYTYEQIKYYVHILIPDSRSKSGLTSGEIDFCNDLGIKVSAHLKPTFSLAQLFVKC
jgi:hypothetical protein